ncbi:hypothetical protein FACS1894206_08260 [Deltaproteobacteria bacterium]|nr:hypothetical protein FACS1894206_08260 [Deltaproteobacteria bacterium]
MTESAHGSWEEFVLHNDAGDEVRFNGKLFSESSYFDEENGSLTRLKLFVTDDGRQVYSVVSGSDAAKWRRVYIMRIEDSLCHISNGLQEISLPTDLLLTVVFGLCGLDELRGEAVRAFLEDSRKTANL